MFKLIIKFVSLCIILLITVMGFSACTSGNSAENSEQNSIQQYQKPESEANIVGIIKTMVGNEITITQYDLSEIEEKTPTTITEEEKTTIVASGGIGSGGGMGGGTGNGSGDPTAIFDSMESLGDIKITIPVGIQMIKTGGGRIKTEEQNNTPQDNNASLEDVKVGGMLTIWLNKEIADRNIAEFVVIRSM